MQDPKNKRNIICDESLQALFRVNSINMFQMNKALTRHIWPLDEENGISLIELLLSLQFRVLLLEMLPFIFGNISHLYFL